MDIDSYSICKPIKGICKQYAIWFNKGATSFPVIYFQRPKQVCDRDWELLMKSIRLDLKKEEDWTEDLSTTKEVGE